MQFRSKPFVVALVGLAFVASSASAATVNFILDLTGAAGTFNVLAESSPGDNGGIGSYGLVMTGPILTVDHNSPKSAAAQNTVTQAFGTAGFTSLRTADNLTTLLASQDTITPTPHLIYGFGQQAGSFAALNLNSLDPMTEGATWESELLIASGTYTVGSGEPGFDETNFDTFSNVFVTSGQAAVENADLTFETRRTGGGEFMVDDLMIPPRQAGALVVGGPLSTNATVADIDWSLVSLMGPGGAVAGATVDPASGVFNWQSLASSPLGPYTATIQGVNAGTPTGTDTGLLTFNLVPEPASVTLLGLAMVGVIGFIRRR
jgi:hypothetical protein